MAKLRKIRVLSLAKLQAVVLTFVGLILGIIYSVGGAIYDMATIGLNLGTALAFFALIGMPVILGICGFIIGVLEAFIFNLISGRFAAIAIDFEQGR